MIEILKKRRSIRKYKNRKIEQHKVDTILKAAFLGPCSRSNRTWIIIVVAAKNIIAKLSECREASSQFIANAPIVMVIAGEPDVADTWIEDAAIAATLMQATATSINLGSCWCQVRNRDYSGDTSSSDYIRSILGIPKNYSVECMIGIGYPDEKKDGYKDQDFPYHKVYQEYYGTNHYA